jgi:hypothetical protein
MADGDGALSDKSSGLAARSLMYALLACHQMANYITRLAVPFIVPFIVQEFGFSESQRAMLLNCFTPGESTDRLLLLLRLCSAQLTRMWRAGRVRAAADPSWVVRCSVGVKTLDQLPVPGHLCGPALLARSSKAWRLGCRCLHIRVWPCTGPIFRWQQHRQSKLGPDRQGARLGAHAH